MRAIFLHAFAADRLTWAGTVPAMTGIACETPDLPGHGKALDIVGDGGIDALTAPMAEQLDDGEPAWVIGHSLGGGVALRLAATMPEKVRGLILIAPLGLGEGLDHGALSKVTDVEDTDQMHRFLENLVADPALIAPMFATYALEQLDRPGAREALAKVAQNLIDAENALQTDIAAVTSGGTPVTTLWGAADRIVRPHTGRVQALGEFVELPDAGHIAHVEAMKPVNALIRARIAGE